LKLKPLVFFKTGPRSVRRPLKRHPLYTFDRVNYEQIGEKEPKMDSVM